MTAPRCDGHALGQQGSGRLTVTDSYTSAAFATPDVGTTGASASVAISRITSTARTSKQLQPGWRQGRPRTSRRRRPLVLLVHPPAVGFEFDIDLHGHGVLLGGTAAGDVVFLTNGVPLSTNALVGGIAAASTAFLPVGTNAIVAHFATQGDFLGSSTAGRVVTNTIIYSTTNIIASIVNNNDGTFTLSLIGTPGAQYYVVAGTDVTTLTSTWTPVVGSTNTAAVPTGAWSVVVSNAPPVFFRSIAVNPAL